MLGQLLDPLYPSVEDRAPLPPFYTTGAFAVLVLGYALGPGTLRTCATSLALLLFILLRPCFATESVTTDYSLAGMPVLSLLLFLNVGRGANPPRYLGKPPPPSPPLSSGNNNKLAPLPRGGIGSDNGMGMGVGYDDLTTWPQKFRWAARLATTVRGIGWNWQAKGIAPHPGANQARWAFVRTSLVNLAWHSALKTLAVYGIGFFRTLQPSVVASSSPLGLKRALLDVLIVWCGALWGWNTLGSAHAFGAVLAVGLGVSEPWEWPPMLDSLWKAWSVRQMWSSAYHQMLRRVLQQPGIRAARFLGFKKGTLASRYLQLYLAFFISFSIHWWQQFTITRRDKGEFAFFMMQPVVITIEDLVRWLWGKNVADTKRKERFRSLALLVGYAWTVAAFTVTLHPYVQGMAGTGVIGASSPDESAALWLGQRHGAAYLRA